MRDEWQQMLPKVHGVKMQILQFSNARLSIEFEKNGRQKQNKIDLITGPNGSGKTETLNALASAMSRNKTGAAETINWENAGQRFTSNDQFSWEAAPQRVIAQTFSPFTRFPPPRATKVSLSKIYTDERRNDDKYFCIGLHRTTKLGGTGVSKRTLEQALYRLSEYPESMPSIFQVMKNLSFDDKFELEYKITPSLKKVLATSIFPQGLEDFIEEIVENPSNRSSLRTEASRSGKAALADLLHTAIEVIGRKRLDDNRTFRESFSSGSNRKTMDYAVVQSLSLLRRLDLLSLMTCELTKMNETKFDVASASSGEQQMLCSIIGLSTALRDDSLVLIDEPELSLHPRWQQTYLDSLHSTLQPFNGCHVIVATHSPLIVQRAQTLGDCVIQLSSDYSPTESSERSANASVESTLLNVFDTPVTDSPQLSNEILAAIVDAENGNQKTRQNAIHELERLKRLYSNTTTDNGRSLSLINDAIELVRLPGETDV